MKKIECVLRPVRLHAVKAALAEQGITGMTVTDVRGTGRGGAGETVFPPKIKLEIVTPDEDVDPIIALLLDHARTGEPGDGKIFVLSASHAIRIRTGDTGDAVL